MVYKLPSVWVWLINNGNDRLEVIENRRSEKGRSENENWGNGSEMGLFKWLCREWFT